jgi:uncharacterized membrane protein
VPPALLLVLALAGPARAELTLCNDTAEVQSVALGYRGDTDWSSKGWWNIAPGDCATLVSEALTQRYYYYYADSRSGGFRGQDFTFCTSDTAFEIEGDTDCIPRGFAQDSFREIDTGEAATTFQLSLQAARPDAAPDAPPQQASSGKKSSDGDSTEVGTQMMTAPVEADDMEVDLASLTSALAPGHHGQAFTKRALFQGCELEAGRAFCGFYSDGVKLRVFFNGPTPEDLMYALEEMPVNSPVELEGDAVETQGLERAVVVRAVRPSGAGDPFARQRKALQGEWVSESDANSAISVVGSEIYARYRDDYQSTRVFELAERCAGHPGAGPVFVTRLKGAVETRCYSIRDVSERLRLRPVSGGEELRFRRP